MTWGVARCLAEAHQSWSPSNRLNETVSFIYRTRVAWTWGNFPRWQLTWTPYEWRKPFFIYKDFFVIVNCLAIGESKRNKDKVVERFGSVFKNQTMISPGYNSYHFGSDDPVYGKSILIKRYFKAIYTTKKHSFCHYIYSDKIVTNMTFVTFLQLRVEVKKSSSQIGCQLALLWDFTISS